jgi:putative colanic acid biosynthesis acetyltransferase WcaB
MFTNPINSSSIFWRSMKYRVTDNPRGLMMVAMYRVANFASRARKRSRINTLWAWIVLVAYRFLTEIVFGYEIPAATQIGKSFFIDHGFSIVINKHSVLGDRCRIKHSVTIGCKTLPNGGQGPSPIIGDDVDIGAGAIIIGAVRIGNFAKIGAGAIVMHDVPAGGVVVGPYARVLS